MKKILIFILACLSVFGAFACTSGDTESSAENSSIESVESLEESSKESVSEETESEEEDSSSESEEEDSSIEGGEENGVCTITFAQEGAQTVTRYVNKGESLTDIPEIQPIEGYDVAWSVTDFTNVQKSMEVTVVKTPKTFTITYKVGAGVQISSTTQKARYLEEYELLTASRTGSQFLGWKKEGESEMFSAQGVYTELKDIVLVPVWRLIEGEWVE